MMPKRDQRIMKLKKVLKQDSKEQSEKPVHIGLCTRSFFAKILVVAYMGAILNIMIIIKNK